MNYWLEYCEPPRPKPEGIEWDVFISYRSLDRVWATALYDMLTQCNYKVFLDQYVLVAGKGLASQLAKNLNRSGSGVLIWSKNTADSKWVENEMDAMTARKNESADSDFPFYFVVASLDNQKPPGLHSGQLYLDFSEYPEGPMGADLIRLTSGLVGKPLSVGAVERVAMYDQSMKEEPANLRALARSEYYSKIIESIKSDDPAYTTSATLPGLAINLLIAGKQYSKALEALNFALQRFPKSVRLQQLRGLALRRNKQLDEALYQMHLLFEQGHQDTETLGILAAIWSDIWEERENKGNASGARDALENSRNFYFEGFEKVPTDTYTGINAAAKSALLGEKKKAIELAEKVLAQLDEKTKKRDGKPFTDYWERVTEAEVYFIKGDWYKAITLYHDARIAHQHESGSIQSTATQIRRLLKVLQPPEEIAEKLKEEFYL